MFSNFFNHFSMKRLLLTLLLALSIGVGAAWAQTYELVYEVSTSTGTPSKYVQNYTSNFDFTLTGSSNSWKFTSFNNGQKGSEFDDFRAGRGSNNASVASFATNFAVPEAIAKIEVNVNQLTAANVAKINSVTLETADNSQFTNSTKQTIAKPTGTGTYTILVNESAANLYYKVTFDLAAASNGFFRINNIKYYKENKPVGPEAVTPIFSDLTVNYGESVSPVLTEPADFFEKAGDVTYTLSYNEAVVEGGNVLTIDDAGNIRATCAGEAIVTASWENSYNYYEGSATFNVTVNTLKPTLSYSAETCEVILEEEPYAFPEFTADTNTKGLTVVYSSSVEEVAKVDKNTGEVVPMREGETTITAKIEAVAGQNEGAEASYVLTVKPVGALAAPVFEPVSGIYTLSEIVSISAPTGATIYYGIGTTKADATTEYTEEFMLEELGEVTYVAYATKDGIDSEIATATYNVVKESATFEFNAAAGEIMMGSLLDIDALLNNPQNLDYTLSTDATDVARVALNDPKRIWLMAPGAVTITATPVETETLTAAATTYSLTVKEEVGAPVETSAIWDFVENNYGMTPTNSAYNEAGGTSYSYTEGDITFTTNKGEGIGTRLFENTKGREFRVYTNSSITFSVKEGLIKQVEFTVGFGKAFNCSPSLTNYTWTDANGKSSVTFTANGGQMNIASVKITYTKPGDPAHCYAALAMGEDREALANATTMVEAATIANDAYALVEYIVLDENGVVSDEVEAVAKDGQLEVTSIDNIIADYTLIAYIDPYKEANGKYYAQVVEVPLYVREVITPAELYIHGHFCDRYYDLTNPVKMVKNGKVFTANDILIGGNEATADKAYDFVFSTHKLDLAEATEQSMMRAAAAAGSHQWEALTEGFVYHNPMGNVLTATPAADITEAGDLTPIHEGEDAKGKAGFYQFNVDFSQDAAAPTFVAEFTGDVTTGVEGVVVESADEAVYYDLTGRRVLNPSTGIVIRVQGGKAEKIMLK